MAMSPTDSQDVRREIDSNSRIRDGVPELIPTALARELVNHYPAEVKRASDRLASLAGELLQRERQNANEERSNRLRETAQLRDRIRRLEAELADARERSAEIEKAAKDGTTDLRARLDAIAQRVKAFGRGRRASKKAMVGQVVAMARAPAPSTQNAGTRART
jgi:chromosome segregation ATPase